jgi:5-methylcytosine-specific restriction enzyme subunit McrC
MILLEMDNNFNQCIKQVYKTAAVATKDNQNKRNLYDILFLLDEVSDAVISADECRKYCSTLCFTSFETVRDYCVCFGRNSVLSIIK